MTPSYRHLKKLNACPGEAQTFSKQACKVNQLKAFAWTFKVF